MNILLLMDRRKCAAGSFPLVGSLLRRSYCRGGVSRYQSSRRCVCCVCVCVCVRACVRACVRVCVCVCV